MLQLEMLPVPLRRDADDVVRVGQTRVPVNTVVQAFESGLTPEQIVQDFSSLTLSDVYAAIAYYLSHQAAVNEYLQQRGMQAEEIQNKVESRSLPDSIRQRLLSRQK